VGGRGLTRAVRALARQVRGAFEDGSCIADLAAVSDPSLAATTVATALQVKLGTRPPLEAIAQALGPRRMLLVLDNCEHLLHAVSQLVQALDPPDRAYVKSFSARTCAALGDAGFEQALALGRGLSIDQALGQMHQYLDEQP
jgi:hypothetical protein